MSAFVVSKEHIDAVVRLGLEGPEGVPVQPGSVRSVRWYTTDPRSVVWTGGDPTTYFRQLETISRELRHETADETGQMLIEACVRSVRHRYPDDPDDLPGPIDAYYRDPTGYTYRPHFAPGSPYRVAVRTPTAVEGLKLLRLLRVPVLRAPGLAGLRGAPLLRCPARRADRRPAGLQHSALGVARCGRPRLTLRLCGRSPFRPQHGAPDVRTPKASRSQPMQPVIHSRGATTCAVCDRTAPTETHPCRFGGRRLCSCWHGRPCKP